MEILLFVVLGAFAAIIYLVSRVGSRGRNLPPGPPTVPFLGNILQIPTHHTYLKLTEWAKTYGGMYSLKIGPDTMIVLTDRRLVKQLLDKKSSIYSTRPPSYLNQLVTDGDHVLFMGYNPKWRAIRKTIHNYLKESMVVNQHTKVVDAEAVQMCRDFLITPVDHMLHPKRFSNSIAMSLTYGLRTPSPDTPHMIKLGALIEIWSEIVEVGNAPPVDQIPALKYLPEILFRNWKSRARNVRKRMNALYSQYLDIVIYRREKGVNKGSFIDGILDQERSLDFDRHQLYFLAGNMMEGASDTASSTINNFILAIMKWPEVMKKAQREIDSVVGEDRTPTFDDYEKLPYVAATVKEAVRWRPAAPLGIPHAVSEDDWIDGFLIPKGATIIMNIWGMHRDETYFKNPEIFDPDRYYGVTKLAPELAIAADYESRDHYGYGAGRRLCAGMHLGERELFLGIAKLLWAFEFGPGEDASGLRIEPEVDVVRASCPGVLLCAYPYRCETKVRSEKRREAILREFSLAEKEVFSRYED